MMEPNEIDSASREVVLAWRRLSEHASSINTTYDILRTDHEQDSRNKDSLVQAMRRLEDVFAGEFGHACTNPSVNDADSCWYDPKAAAPFFCSAKTTTE